MIDVVKCPAMLQELMRGQEVGAVHWPCGVKYLTQYLSNVQVAV